MMSALATTIGQEVVIEIGGMPIQVRCKSPEFVRTLVDRYSGFLSPAARPVMRFDVELVQSGKITREDDIAVRFESGRWLIERNDLRAEWNPSEWRCRIVQSPNPYSMDTALRIVQTLILAREGGLLVHAASAVRNGRAFVFAGVSGSGKTTIASLAPADVMLLTDEISFLRRNETSYVAYGTPFAGEMAKLGENIQAPQAALYLLQKGPENTIEPMREVEAVRRLLENVLFFAQDPELVGLVFEAACELVRCVPVYQLTFVPDQRVWELIA